MQTLGEKVPGSHVVLANSSLDSRSNEDGKMARPTQMQGVQELRALAQWQLMNREEANLRKSDRVSLKRLG